MSASYRSGGQAGGEDDAAELPPVPSERGAAVTERDRLQPGELPELGISEGRRTGFRGTVGQRQTGLLQQKVLRSRQRKIRLKQMLAKGLGMKHLRSLRRGPGDDAGAGCRVRASMRKRLTQSLTGRAEDGLEVSALPDAVRY